MQARAVGHYHRRLKSSLIESRLICFLAIITLQCLCAVARAQDLNVDSDRVYMTPLHWQKVAGAPPDEKLRQAYGKLAILYREGVYAEVAASFIKTNSKAPVELNLKEGFIVRLGTWTRTEDEGLIHIQSRGILGDTTIQKVSCKVTPSGKACSLEPEAQAPKPVSLRTCRLEHRSEKQFAEAIVCEGLTVFHPQKPIDLSDLPSIVRQALDAQ